MLKLVQRVSHPSNKIYLRIHTIQIRNSTSPYPIRPGFGLGSMIPGTIIEGMKKEAHIRGKIIAYQQLYNDLESTERELVLELNQIENNLSTSQTLKPITGLSSAIDEIQKVRQNILDQKLDAYKELAKWQLNSLTAASTAAMQNTSSVATKAENMTFSTFDSSIESPVNWGDSKIDYIDRGEDSIQINAHFFDQNKVKQSGGSYAANVAHSASYDTKTLFGSKFEASINDSVHRSVTKTSEQHAVESTLLLTAVATHKFVKQFNPLIIDTTKLVNAWNYMHIDDKISVKGTLEEGKDNTKTDKPPNHLSMISEEFLGSCLIGMVHFIKKEETQSRQESLAVQATARMKVTESCILASITGQTSIASQVASKFAEASSSTGIDVKFD
eukprot:450554_1